MGSSLERLGSFWGLFDFLVENAEIEDPVDFDMLLDMTRG